MLKSLVSGEIPSRFVLLQDTAIQSARGLLHAHIQHHISSGSNVHVLCCEHHVDVLKKRFKIPDEETIFFHDGFSDHLGWIGGEDGMEVNRNPFAYLEKVVGGAKKLIVVIDSLSSFILCFGLKETYRQLHSILSKPFRNETQVEQLICLLHEDVVDDITATQLAHLSTTRLRVLPPSEKYPNSLLCDILHKKPTGKVLKELDVFNVNEENCVIDVKPAVEVKPSKTASEADAVAEVIPRLTTFNLNLRESEKKAKSQLVLPYMRSEEKPSGQIYYQPDEADDWDEEDPDDDLDI